MNHGMARLLVVEIGSIGSKPGNFRKFGSFRILFSVAEVFSHADEHTLKRVQRSGQQVRAFIQRNYVAPASGGDTNNNAILHSAFESFGYIYLNIYILYIFAVLSSFYYRCSPYL